MFVVLSITPNSDKIFGGKSQLPFSSNIVSKALILKCWISPYGVVGLDNNFYLTGYKAHYSYTRIPNRQPEDRRANKWVPIRYYPTKYIGLSKCWGKLKGSQYYSRKVQEFRDLVPQILYLLLHLVAYQIIIIFLLFAFY